MVRLKITARQIRNLARRFSGKRLSPEGQGNSKMK